MKIFIQTYNNNLQHLELLNSINKKKIITLSRLFLHYIFKSQYFMRLIFRYINRYNRICWNSLNIKKKCAVYQVLKSPHVHKKSQNKYLLQQFTKIELINFCKFSINKLYSTFLNNLFFVISLKSLFYLNYIKLKFTYKYKIHI